MELAFREPVRMNNGDIKYPAGIFYEWPRETFLQIAKNVGKPLDDLTVTKEEAGKVFTANIVGIKKGKVQGKSNGEVRRKRTRLPPHLA